MAKKKASKKKVTKKKVAKEVTKKKVKRAPAAKKKATKKRSAKLATDRRPSSTRKRASKSAYHICFARGTLGNSKSWRAVKETDVQDGDFEFFTDKHGVGLNRARVSAPLKLLKGYSGKGIRGANKSFMAQVRVGSHCVQTGWKLIEDFCAEMRVPMPPQALKHKEAWLQRQRETMNAGGSIGARARAAMFRSKTPVSDVPDDWTMEVKTKATTGQKYKVYISPCGKKLYSRAAVARFISAS